jgi:hypothetical protein
MPSPNGPAVTTDKLIRLIKAFERLIGAFAEMRMYSVCYTYTQEMLRWRAVLDKRQAEELKQNGVL